VPPNPLWPEPELNPLPHEPRTRLRIGRCRATAREKPPAHPLPILLTPLGPLLALGGDPLGTDDALDRADSLTDPLGEPLADMLGDPLALDGGREDGDDALEDGLLCPMDDELLDLDEDDDELDDELEEDDSDPDARLLT